MASIKDISKLTGLSLATVSRVFNNSSLVSDKTKQKVLKAAKELDYQPNMMAAALRSGKSKIIGVIVPEINNHFFSGVINGIEKILSDQNYHIIISQSHESEALEKKALQSFMQLNVDGVLMSISKETTDFSLIQKIMGQKIPVVFFDRTPSIDHASSVVLDDYKGAFIATQHLIDNGCKHIIHIAGDSKVSIFNRRREGFIDALKENNQIISEDDILLLGTDISADTLILKELFQKYPLIDGIFGYGDEACLYIINILNILEIAIPQQIQVIGFGNIDFTEHTSPKISTVDQKCTQMGLLAAEMLLKNLDNEQIIHSQQVLSPALIVRESTKSPN